MLKLKNISKKYYVADMTVDALKEINLTFRKNEFVSILGPSGSGKTTLLNIVGGLDKYSSGDLVINGRRTKDFKDRDWDVYRNHRVGFVFQSYNLIPHQTVLSNVELALTIAGMSKEERIKKAKDALDKVGLSDQYYKKPNQLSGGQSQRVAIARALVNDPEILLADEPTGALDSKTSIQILNLIKEIAKDRLVIMVTHNSELAVKYSTRVVSLLDGKLQSDTNPLTEEELKVSESLKAEEKTNKQKKETAKMSWWTTFKLSILNLLSKKSRTILTSIAGSIGIIGISLVLSLSYGLQAFIDKTQNDMLSGNPIVIEEKTLDLNQMMQGPNFSDKEILDVLKGYVNVNGMIERIAERASEVEGIFIENNITETYIDYLLNLPPEDAAAVFLDYEIDITNNLYIDFYENETTKNNISLSVLKQIITSILIQNEETKSYANLITNFTDIINQAPNNIDYINSQYEILDGKIATLENEIMLVLDEDSSVSDLILAQLGYYSQEEFINMIFKATNDSRYDENIEIKKRFSYQELMDKSFVWYPNNVVYNDNSANIVLPTDPKFTYNAYSSDFDTFDSNTVIELKIVGILKPKEDLSYGSLRNGFYYTEALTKHIIENSINSEVVNYLVDNEKEGFSNTPPLPNSTTTNAITYNYSYNYLGVPYEDQKGYVGKTSSFSSFFNMIGMGGGGDVYVLSKRDLGGNELASKISIYPINLDKKANVLNYLDDWNKDVDIIVNGNLVTKSEREEIIYSDPLSIIFKMLNQIINMITIALIGFTTLALVVSSVMIAIITYVSVVERIKEIGVIRSLGGRKKDVANLFIAETFIIGLTSGIIAIIFTYFASFIINLIVINSIGSKIAVLPWNYALTMIIISVLLTLISGFVPSRSAAKKDPVVALRTE